MVLFWPQLNCISAVGYCKKAGEKKIKGIYDYMIKSPPKTTVL